MNLILNNFILIFISYLLEINGNPAIKYPSKSVKKISENPRFEKISDQTVQRPYSLADTRQTDSQQDNNTPDLVLPENESQHNYQPNQGDSATIIHSDENTFENSVNDNQVNDPAKHLYHPQRNNNNPTINMHPTQGNTIQHTKYQQPPNQFNGGPVIPQNPNNQRIQNGQSYPQVHDYSNYQAQQPSMPNDYSNDQSDESIYEDDYDPTEATQTGFGFNQQSNFPIGNQYQNMPSYNGYQQQQQQPGPNFMNQFPYPPMNQGQYFPQYQSGIPPMPNLLPNIPTYPTQLPTWPQPPIYGCNSGLGCFNNPFMGAQNLCDGQYSMCRYNCGGYCPKKCCIHRPRRQRYRQNTF